MTHSSTITIDATNQPVGRLASRIAHLLQGKHKVGSQKHRVLAQSIVVRNCSRLRIDKRKLTQKLYYRTSGHPGGLKAQPLGEVFAKNPSSVLRRSVAGMLPKNTLREKRMNNLSTLN